jgi:pyruvate formate lyase activating enzyme
VLDGVAITGGETLLQPDIADFIKSIRALGYPVKLDTNGSRPKVLRRLIDEGLVDYVAMDVKNAPSRYGETVGIANFDIAPVRQSVEFLLKNVVPYEFRTTVVKQLHGQEEAKELASFIAGAEKLYLQAFIDSGNLIGSGLSAMPKEDMQKMAFLLEKTVKKVELRGV